MKWFALALVLFFWSIDCYSQDTLMTKVVDDVQITATRIPVMLYKAPQAVHKVKIDALENNKQTFSINEVIGKLPGVFALNQYNSAQDLRVSIRGFGSRSAFGIRGVKILMDGIPLSTPDGQGQVDNIFVGGLRNVEVLNGSSSALYGNASGGLLSLTTFSESKQDQHFLSLGSGSFGDFRASIQSHKVLETIDIDHQLSYASHEGYRDFSANTNMIYNGRIRKYYGDDHKLSLIVNAVYSPRGEDPGGINLESVESDRKSARSNNVDFMAGEEVFQMTAGIKHEYSIKENTNLASRIFYTIRDFENRLPFEDGGQVDLLRNYGGASTQLTRQFSNGSWENTVIVGADFAYQNDRRIRYVNLQGERGEETLNQNEIFINQALFVSGQSIYANWLINGGLRFDNNLIRVKDQFPADGIAEGDIALPNLSPSLSVSYNVLEYHYVAALFSYGFETPTLSELSSRPDNQGGLNTELRPQESYNYEVSYKAFNLDKFAFTFSAFLINSQNELLPYELEDFPGRTFYRNSGKTNRQGIEVSLFTKLREFLDFDMAYTYSNFEFAETGDISGNKLPGIPVHNLAAGLTFDNEIWKANFQIQSFSSIYVNSSNELSAPAYTLGSVSVSRRVRAFIPYIGVNNIFNNLNYYDNIRINAFGGRFYEVGPPRNFYIGVKFEF
jgi:iron complex outermembrane receptor protein